MISLRSLSYRYPSGREIGPLSLEVAPGEKVVLAGASGSGKTTLLRAAAGLSGAMGLRSGEVSLSGEDPAALPADLRPTRLGFVSQEPQDQILCGSVEDELAFGPERAGLAYERIEQGITRGMTLLGGLLARDRDPHTLSTGEQQRLAVAAALSAGARHLLLDEPLAHLDPDGIALLLSALDEASRSGVSVLMSEHRLRWVSGWASRVAWIGPELALQPRIFAKQLRSHGEIVLSSGPVSQSYDGRVVLDRFEVTLRAGERVALLGRNGAGKSTLLGHLSGRLGRPLAIDAIEIPADPDLTLFCGSVSEEIAFAPRERGLGASALRERCAAIAESFGLQPLLDRPPQALSRGQRLKVAVAAAAAASPRVLLLDEPTAGQDQPAVEDMLDALDRALPRSAILFATHDRDLAERFADRSLSLGG